MRVLVVQADESARASQRDLLSGAELTVASAGSGAEALEKLREGAPDLVVLGRSLPDMDGLDLLPQLKGVHDQFMPVLIASHRSNTAERVLGLQKGADDYLALPCDPDELLARVRALLRRGKQPGKVLAFADVTLDVATRAVMRAGRPVSLSEREADLLRLLLENARRVVTRERALAQIWHGDASLNVVDRYVSNLRRKLGEPPLIETVRGVGFVIGR